MSFAPPVMPEFLICGHIREAKQPVTVEELIKKTGLSKRQVNNSVYILQKKKKIRANFHDDKDTTFEAK